MSCLLVHIMTRVTFYCMVKYYPNVDSLELVFKTALFLGKMAIKCVRIIQDKAQLQIDAQYFCFYARKHLLLSACLSHRNSVRLSVRLSVTWLDQSKTVQDRITISSPSAAWKILISGTIKHFHIFEGGYLK